MIDMSAILGGIIGGVVYSITHSLVVWANNALEKRKIHKKHMQQRARIEARRNQENPFEN